MSLDPASVARLLGSLPEDEEARRIYLEIVKRLADVAPADLAAGATSPIVPSSGAGTVAGGSIVQNVSGTSASAINSGNALGGKQTIEVLGTMTERPRPPASSPALSPVRILFLGANPRDSTPLRLDEEVREIDQALTSAQLGDRFELVQKWAVRTIDLQSHLLRAKPQIMHFSGHGSNQNAIILEGEDRKSRPVPAAQLTRLLAQFSGQLRCVVLNSCYSEEQAQAIASSIDCVVGMSTAVADRASIRFAASFYQGLAFGRSIRSAFDLACADPELGRLGQDSVPRLVALRQDVAGIVFARPKET